MGGVWVAEKKQGQIMAEQLWGRAKMGALGGWRRAGQSGRDSEVCVTLPEGSFFS